jgi:hypothetical protein
MKFKKQMRCGLLLLLVLCFSLTGCGTQLYELTDDEEETIVLYSAKVVSKFNRAQDTGYCQVSQDVMDRKAEEANASEEDATSQMEEAAGAIQSFSDIIAIDGLQFEYQGYDVTTEYSTQDIVIPDADAGNSYLVVHIQITNTTDQDMQVDLLTNPISYTLSVNDSVSADCESTLSMEDLSTYYNSSFAANSTDDTVLLFQVKTEYLEDISSLALQVTKQGQTYNVILL